MFNRLMVILGLAIAALAVVVTTSKAETLTDPIKELGDYDIVGETACVDGIEVGVCYLLNKGDKVYIAFHNGDEVLVVWSVKGLKQSYDKSEMTEVFRKKVAWTADPKGSRT